VQKQGDTMRITTQLVATEDGRHLWASAYDRPVENLFAVQDEIAGEVAAALRVALLKGSDAIHGGTENFEAYREYLLGLERAQERTVESIAAAERHFSRASELDPGYALAHVGYADAISLQHYYSNRPISEIKALALPALEKAMSLDPNLGEAYAALGLILFNAGEIEEAETALRRAVALSPNYARAYFGFGSVYNDSGRPAQALEMHLRALELNPLAPHINNAVGVAYEKLGLFEEAAAQFERTIEVAPDYGAVRYRFGMLKWNVHGDAKRAIRLYEQAIEMDPDNPWGPTLMSRLFLDLGDDAKAAEWLEVAEGPGERISTAEIRALLLTREGASAQQRLDIVREFSDQVKRFGFTEKFLRIARDAYLEERRPEDALELFRQTHPGLFGEQVAIDWLNFESAVDLAYVMKLVGDQRQADLLLANVEAYIRTIPKLGCCGYGLADVEIAAIRGDTETALASLEQAIAEGWKMDWWWETDYNPNLSSLHDDERYRAAIDALSESIVARQAAAAGVRLQ
jgi:tetratricopeptide (TPR) repeat protein